MGHTLTLEGLTVAWSIFPMGQSAWGFELNKMMEWDRAVTAWWACTRSGQAMFFLCCWSSLRSWSLKAATCCFFWVARLAFLTSAAATAVVVVCFSCWTCFEGWHFLLSRSLSVASRFVTALRLGWSVMVGCVRWARYLKMKLGKFSWGLLERLQFTMAKNSTYISTPCPYLYFCSPLCNT